MKKETTEEYILRQEKEVRELLTSIANKIDNIKAIDIDAAKNTLQLAKEYLNERFDF